MQVRYGWDSSPERHLLAWADGSASGEGMGTFPGCEAGTWPFGPVLGEFDVRDPSTGLQDGQQSVGFSPDRA